MATGQAVQKPAWDYQGVHVPAANTQATVTFISPDPNRYFKVDTILAVLHSAGAVAGVARGIVQVLDGAAIIWSFALVINPATATTGNISTQYLTNLALYCTPGNNVTIQFVAAGGANTFEMINAGAYVV